jgi:hypothetical protein
VRRSSSARRSAHYLRSLVQTEARRTCAGHASAY